MFCFRIDTAQRRLGIAALAGAIKLVLRRRGAVDWGSLEVVIPAVRVVIRDDDGGVLPLRILLQRIDDAHYKFLFVEWRGIAGMTIQVSRRFQNGDGRKIA